MEHYSIFWNKKLVRDSGKYDIQEERDMLDKVINLMIDICGEPCGTTVYMEFLSEDFTFSVECGVEHITKFMGEIKKIYPDIEDYMEVKIYEPEGA